MLVKERDIACFCGGFSAAIVAAILLFVVLLGAAGCTSSRSAAPAGVPPLLASPSQVQQLDSAALAGWLPRDYTTLACRRTWYRPRPARLPGSAASGKKPRPRTWPAPACCRLKSKTARWPPPPGPRPSIARPRRWPRRAAPPPMPARPATAALGLSAVATSTHASVSWWVWLLVAVGGAVVWELFSAKVTPVQQLLKWRFA